MSYVAIMGMGSVIGPDSLGVRVDGDRYDCGSGPLGLG